MPQFFSRCLRLRRNGKKKPFESKTFFLDLHISLKVIQRDIYTQKERERKKREIQICYLLVYSLNGHSGLCWPRLKPEARSFIWSPTWVTGAQVPSPSFACLPRHIGRLLNQRWRSWDVNQYAHGMPE